MLEQGNTILDNLKAFLGFGQVKSFTFEQPSVYLEFLTKNEEQEDEAEITLEEKDLVEDLRFFCISTGQEKIKCLNETAEIFYKLGMLYMKEIEERSGLQQRLHIIRCSVLLNGAKCRFKRIDNLSGISSADEALEMLHQKVFTLAPVKQNLDKLNLAEFMKIFHKVR